MSAYLGGGGEEWQPGELASQLSSCNYYNNTTALLPQLATLRVQSENRCLIWFIITHVLWCLTCSHVPCECGGRKVWSCDSTLTHSELHQCRQTQLEGGGLGNKDCHALSRRLHPPGPRARAARHLSSPRPHHTRPTMSTEMLKNYRILYHLAHTIGLS